MYDALCKLKFSKSYNLCDTFLDFENFSFGTYLRKKNNFYGTYVRRPSLYKYLVQNMNKLLI